MTEHLTMNTIVHAAFRRTIARFVGALDTFPDGSRERADQLERAWDFAEDEIHHHHDYEEQYFWPALQQTDADLRVVAELDGEHEAMRAALGAASRAMAALPLDPTTATATVARDAVAHLGTVLGDHLAHEERDLEPISAAYKNAPPMKTALRQVKKAHFKTMGNTIEWLKDGADSSDIAGLRKELPPPVIFLFTRIAGRRYRREIAPTWATS
ncbi:hemerythrin domain-containing protein [Antrihabitans sp. YC3-6]|uniref:Hemerythrin domain-containing protein n=1 Tax=Antrihabitans stalagmiti TaxID=2799499 RepID=A0A934NU55_9NOCA|nr:hemerythrin domain-containing protein [Antrihabitans stalagmiti]MBJ8341348.1 hemerythrin domain-containing protein [Antrihabitans stalagmiti]